MSYKLLLFGNTVRVFVSSLFAPLLAIFAKEIGGTLIDVGGDYFHFDVHRQSNIHSLHC